MKPELLSPAGDYESLKRAVMCGADAVYFGLKRFNARASAANFDEDSLKSYIDFCHLYGVKAYIAFNIAIKDAEMKDAANAVKKIYKSKADGIIIADPGLIPVIDKEAGDLPVHISTQAGVHNIFSAEFFYKLGADRVVLSREVSKEDIKEINAGLDIETEYFVQGALCVSFSGGCLLSSYLFGGSGNRGGCLQPCRLKYTLESNHNIKRGYMLSASDLCLLGRLNELIELGISSFKIEGRMRRAEYVGEATRAYRSVLDGKTLPKDEITYLKRAFNRGDYSEGYMYSDNAKMMSTAVQNHIGEYCGRVLRTFDKGGYPYAEVLSEIPLTKGDGLKILRKGLEAGGADVHSAEPIGKDRYIIPVSEGVKSGDLVYLTTDKSRNDFINSIEKRIPVKIVCRMNVGFGLSAEFISNGVRAVYESGYIVEEGKNSPLKKEDIISRLAKLSDTPFFAEDVSVIMDEKVFAPVSAINELRRNCSTTLEKEIVNAYTPTRRKNSQQFSDVPAYKNGLGKTAVEVQSASQLFENFNCDYLVYRPDVYSKEDLREFIKKAKALTAAKIYLALPKILTQKDSILTDTLIAFLKEENCGVFCENFGAVGLARINSLPYGGGVGLNIYNGNTLKILHDADFLTASPELDDKEAGTLLDSGAFLYAYGFLPLMTLKHCPVKLISGKDCAECGYSGEFYYKSDKGDFPAVRTKAAECLFTLFSPRPVDRTGYKKAEVNRYINLYKIDEKTAKNLLNQGNL